MWLWMNVATTTTGGATALLSNIQGVWVWKMGRTTMWLVRPHSPLGCGEHFSRNHYPKRHAAMKTAQALKRHHASSDASYQNPPASCTHHGPEVRACQVSISRNLAASAKSRGEDTAHTFSGLTKPLPNPGMGVAKPDGGAGALGPSGDAGMISGGRSGILILLASLL